MSFSINKLIITFAVILTTTLSYNSAFTAGPDRSKPIVSNSKGHACSSNDDCMSGLTCQGSFFKAYTCQPSR